MKKTICDSNQIAYQHRGSNEKIILFIHGLGCSKRSFHDAFSQNYFPNEYTLIAPDLLGHGESASPDNSQYDMQDHATLVKNMLDQFEYRELNIVAHSMGGAVALLLTNFIDKIHSIALLEGNLILEDCKISRRVAKMGEDKFVNGVFPRAPINYRCQGNESDPEINPKAYFRSAKSLVEWSSSGKLLDIYTNLSIRKSYIYGDRNSSMPVISRLNEATVFEIPNSGHFMMNDNPEDTYAVIAKNLDS